MNSPFIFLYIIFPCLKSKEISHLLVISTNACYSKGWALHLVSHTAQGWREWEIQVLELEAGAWSRAGTWTEAHCPCRTQTSRATRISTATPNTTPSLRHGSSQSSASSEQSKILLHTTHLQIYVLVNDRLRGICSPSSEHNIKYLVFKPHKE